MWGQFIDIEECDTHKPEVMRNYNNNNIIRQVEPQQKIYGIGDHLSVIQHSILWVMRAFV